MSTSTIPVTVEPEAAELVAELGMQAEFERMLDQARQTIPGLRRIVVEFAPPYDTGPDPGVLIMAYRDPSFRRPDDSAWDQYSRWKTTTFHPDVFRHFTLWIVDDTNHAG